MPAVMRTCSREAHAVQHSCGRPQSSAGLQLAARSTLSCAAHPALGTVCPRLHRTPPCAPRACGHGSRCRLRPARCCPPDASDGMRGATLATASRSSVDDEPLDDAAAPWPEQPPPAAPPTAAVAAAGAAAAAAAPPASIGTPGAPLPAAPVPKPPGSPLASVSDMQHEAADRLASLAHVVEEAAAAGEEDEEAAAQLVDVLQKLEQLETAIAATIQHHPASAAVGVAGVGDAGGTGASAAAAVDVAAAEAPPAAHEAVGAAAAAAAGLSPSTAEAMAAVQMAADVAVAVELRAAVTAVELSAAAAAASVAMGGKPREELAAAAAPTAAAAAAPSADAGAAAAADSAKLWALFVLGVSYVHQATTGFALPALLPQISPDLGLSDFQGAMLTSGYSYLYALALVPVGLLADRTSRPHLLAAGLTLWSTLSMLAGRANSFNELLLARVGFAAAQATQNPVAFSLIPDLFPTNKSTALAAYNCAIYLGRALSFAGVLAAARLGAPGVPAAKEAAEVALSMVPLDKLDLQRMSIIYTSGDMAAVTPIYNYNFHVIAYEAAAGASDGGWRRLMFWLGIPGFLIAALLVSSVKDPRLGTEGGGGGGGGVGAVLQRAGRTAGVWVRHAVRRGGGALKRGDGWRGGAGAAAAQLRALGSASSPADASGALVGLGRLARMPAFRAVTLAAALNDLGSYALIAWHSTFYERVFGLSSGVYAPMLAVILPVGGIMGGVGGGLLADWLSTIGGRKWLTAGASILAAPFIAKSLLADNSTESFLALLAGFALSEAWRAPSAIMIRTIAPPEMGSTASALYLCARNLVGGIGPLAVAKLAGPLGLQQAMLLSPACYVISGLLFWVAESIMERDAHNGTPATAAAEKQPPPEQPQPGQQWLQGEGARALLVGSGQAGQQGADPAAAAAAAAAAGKGVLAAGRGSNGGESHAAAAEAAPADGSGVGVHEGGGGSGGEAAAAVAPPLMVGATASVEAPREV